MPLLVDIGVSTVVGRYIPGKGGMALGGALGGAAGELASGHYSPDDIGKGAMYGAVGGLVGHGVAKGLQVGLNRGLKATETALKGVKGIQEAVPNAAKATADAADDVVAAQKALKTAKGLVTKAENALKRAGKKATPAQQAAKTSADSKLTAANKAVGDANKATQDAADAVKKARQDGIAYKKANPNKTLDARRTELEEKIARQKKREEFLFGKGNGKKRGEAGYEAPGWGPDILRGLGAGGAYLFRDANRDDPTKGKNPGDPANQEYVWDGEHVRLFQQHKPPFIIDPDIQSQVLATELGFLLQPKNLNAQLKAWHAGPGNSVATALNDNHEYFGNLAQKKDPTLTKVPKLAGSVGQMTGFGGESKAGEAYRAAATSLNAAADQFYAREVALLKKVIPEKVETTTLDGQTGISELIKGMNMAVAGGGATTDKDFMSVMSGALQGIEDIAGEGDAKSGKAADEVKTLTDQWDKWREEQAKIGANQSAEVQKSIAGLSAAQQNPGFTPQTPNFGNLGNQWNPNDLNPPGTPGTPGFPGTPSTPDIPTPPSPPTPPATPGDPDTGKSTLQNALDRILPPTSTPNLSNTPPFAGAGAQPAGFGGGISPMDMAMMSGMFNPNRNAMQPNPELDPDRYRDDPAIMAPPAATVPPPVTAQPAATAPPTTATPAQNIHAPVTNAPPGTPVGGLPGRTPDPDGNVTYTFTSKDGSVRTQKVSLQVAQALDAAFASKDATSAEGAYKNTKAKWTEPKMPDKRIGNSDLMTGDVGLWEVEGGKFSSAVLVAFPDREHPENGTLEAIVNGELVEMGPLMANGGELGSFAGFAHPRGIEMAGPADGGPGPGMAELGDQSAAATMPGVTLTAG
ncbi:hypothetical protein [Nocardia sp. NPDC051463]|uniref:hypothetical protein n=1 Tax=Nocardia sp. NPDC051463 TaxID=3154845 RepID=UPI0034413E24